MRTIRTILQAFIAAVGRMDKSLSPQDTINRIRQHTFTLSDTSYLFQAINAIFWLSLLPSPLAKFGIPLAYTIAVLVPFTSQFFFRATPIFSWLITYFPSRYLPVEWRPDISVAMLPALESVLYGANISDILTRFTHPILDVMAWLPYGFIHFCFPFFVAAFCWLFRKKEVLHLWGRMFGFMNLVGVFMQILIPCAAPWYELIHGLTPANYSMHGSAGGLVRIDAVLHTKLYSTNFGNSPIIFGAFPSLHAGCATMEALFMSHFFPQTTKYIWGYAGLLYWATMYLTHHYLVDVVVGACLSTVMFYLFLPDEMRGAAAVAPPGGGPLNGGRSQRTKYEIYDLEAPRTRANGRPNGQFMAEAADFDLASEGSSGRESDEEEMDITFRSPIPGGTPTSAMGMMNQQQQQSAAQAKKNHRHTASIASLIRADERAEDGWSPITTGGFNFPPTPTRTESEEVRR